MKIQIDKNRQNAPSTSANHFPSNHKQAHTSPYIVTNGENGILHSRKKVNGHSQRFQADDKVKPQQQSQRGEFNSQARET